MQNQVTRFSDINETKVGAKYLEASEADKTRYHILGRLHAPFFDTKNATRNGRYYGEAAKDALNSDEFKEKMATRTFFGRLGHPCTEEEMAEDPAVRACVIMSDYSYNNDTKMYEATLDIIDNEYGKQLKSLIDAGCQMGVSTRGSGDSYESNGNEVITNYDFECLDVVTLPAVKSARVTVLEAVDKTKKQKLEELIRTTTNKNVLESLKVTVESSSMPDKDKLLEDINKKLSGEVGTIESLVNDIANLSKKLSESDQRIHDLEAKLTDTSASTSETIESEKENSGEKLTENWVKLLRTSTQTLESMKKAIREKDDRILSQDKKLESYSIVAQKAKSTIESLTSQVRRYSESNANNSTEVKSLNSRVAELESLNSGLTNDNDGLRIANERLNENYDNLKASYDKLVLECEELKASKSELVESVKSLKVQNSSLLSKMEGLTKSVSTSKTLTESLSKSDTQVKTLNESLASYKTKATQLESINKRLTADYEDLKTKYVESVATANGISLDSLKSRINSKSTIAMIESAAKSIRADEDARRSALPDIISLGTKVESLSSTQFVDPELDRAGRIARLSQNKS